MFETQTNTIQSFQAKPTIFTEQIVGLITKERQRKICKLGKLSFLEEQLHSLAKDFAGGRTGDVASELHDVAHAVRKCRERIERKLMI
jgi:hypothetical protein